MKTNDKQIGTSIDTKFSKILNKSLTKKEKSLFN